MFPHLTEEEVIACLPLARYVAWKWAQKTLIVSRNLGSILDVYAQAYLFLLNAAQKYDPSRGTKFSTFAMTIIWQRFLALPHDLRRSERPSRNSVHADSVTPKEKWMPDLEKFICRLPTRTQAFLVWRHWEGMNTREIGDMWALTHQRISQIEEHANAQLRRMIEADER